MIVLGLKKMGQRTGEALSNLGQTMFGIGTAMSNKIDETKSSIFKYLVGAQVPDEVNRLFQIAQKNPDANAGLKEFQNSFVGLAKGLMASVPEGEDQLYAGRLLAHSAQQVAGHLEAAAKNQNKNIAKYYIAEAIDKYQDMANQAALGGNLNTALAHQASVAKVMADSIKKGFIAPSAAHTLQKQLKESITKNLYLGHGIAFAKTGDVRGLESAAQDVLHDKTLSHASKTSLLSMMTKMKSVHELQRGLSEESVSELKKEMIFQARTNGKTPTAEQTIFLQSVQPKTAMEIKHAVTDNLEIYNAVQKQRVLPLDKKLEYLEELQKQITQSKSVRESEIYTTAKMLATEEIRAAQKDPVAYIMQLGEDNGIEQELKNYQASPAFQKLGSIGQEEALKQRKASLVIQLEKQLDLEPRLLSNATAQTIVTNLKETGFVNAIPYLQKELDKYGSHADIVLKDLEKAKLPVGLKYTLNASPKYAPTMIKAFGANLKDLETAARIADDSKKTEIVSSINEEIKDYVDTLHFAKDKEHEATELKQAMYISVLQELSEGRSLKRAVANAAEGIYGHQYNEIEGGIRIPKVDENKHEINPEDVKQAKEKFSLDHFFNFQKTNDVYFDGWEAHDDKYNKQLVYDGRWVTAADDSGIFYITSQGKRVYRKSSGKPYAIKFSDIKKK